MLKKNAFLLTFAFISSVFGNNYGPSQDVNWTSYSSDNAQRYSPLDIIDKDNVSNLSFAWHHSSEMGGGTLQATPLVVDGIMYYCSAKSTVYALDATNGKEVWNRKFQRRAIKTAFNACRGVAFQKFPKQIGACSARVYTTTMDGFLAAMDAKTGNLCSDFGKDGIVDLHEGLGDVSNFGVIEVFYTPAPAIYTSNKDTGEGFVVLGGGVLDNLQYKNVPSGVIRAFDLKSGKLKWFWEPLPKKFVKKQLTKEEIKKLGNYQRGTPNAWSFITVDPENDRIFIPFGTPSPDYFIGNRENLPDYLKYGSSLVALNSKGEYIWHYKTVETDVWDYDIPAQPNLIEFEGKKAVVVSTKVGHTFILDRITGEELVPTIKKKVPQSPVNLEIHLADEQKFPTFPAPYYEGKVKNAITLNEEHLQKIAKVSPEAAAECRRLFKESPSEGVFTPPSLKGIIQFPSSLGGSNWSGNSYDPERKILISNINLVPTYTKLFPAGSKECGDTKLLAHGGPNIGGPFCMQATMFKPFVNGKQKNMFCSPPPWGEVLAFDMEKQKLLWRKPVGEFLKGYGKGSQSLGGILTTKSGISFFGGTADKTFRAMDTETGKILWSYKLKAHGAASPMTYSVDGVQYVAIAAGGHFFLDTRILTFGNKMTVFKLGK